MNTTRLILVGGFLGAGKTTLLGEAANRLVAAGKRVGLITNDQAPDLVDTGLLSRAALPVREVSGSCFCCNFSGLIDAAEKLRDDTRVDVLIAEPVGSCTDLSATILQPLKDKFARQFLLAPLSVVADPARLKEVLTGEGRSLHPGAAYILRKQLEEADVILLNKIDSLSPTEMEDLQNLMAGHFPCTEVRCISALTGQGVGEWLADVLGRDDAGARIAEVDYDVYAEGEAALGWLNAAVDLTASGGQADWPGFCHTLLGALQDACRRERAAVGHIKLLLSGPCGQYAGNLTHAQGDIRLWGAMEGSPEAVGLILNARVEMPPDRLETIVRDSLLSAAADKIAVRIVHLRSLSPGRPNPTYRYAEPVSPGFSG